MDISTKNFEFKLKCKNQIGNKINLEKINGYEQAEYQAFGRSHESNLIQKRGAENSIQTTKKICMDSVQTAKDSKVMAPEMASSFFCQICEVQTTGPASYSQHVQGKHHAKKLKLSGKQIGSSSSIYKTPSSIDADVNKIWDGISSAKRSAEYNSLSQIINIEKKLILDAKQQIEDSDQLIVIEANESIPQLFV